MGGMMDEHYPADCFERGASVWQLRGSLDRRFWMTSGGREAIGYGVVDDFGVLVRTEARPFDERVS